MSVTGIVLTGLILLSFSGVCASLYLNGTAPGGAVPASKSVAAPRKTALVIDAGHGGEDGGAVAADGTKEKDIDLLIARNVDALCLLFDVPAVMTRTDDEMLSDRYPDELAGSKKTRDLKNRLRGAAEADAAHVRPRLGRKEADAALLLSIHTNKFPDSSVHGLQVFYSPGSDESRRAAGMIQESLNLNLQPGHTKTEKKANSSIYLLDRSPVPAVLAECGFLSNEEELGKLKTPGYRAATACVLISSVAEFLAGE